MPCMPFVRIGAIGGGLRWTRADWWFSAALFGLSVIIALGLEVNSFPADGWFQSQYRVLAQSPGAGNYTPIAAPAYYYSIVHGVSVVLGMDLASELRLAAIGQTLMLCLSCLAVYDCLLLLGRRRLGMAVSFVLLLGLASTSMTHAFWSESVVTFLVAISLWLIVRSLVKSGMSLGRFALLATALGLLLGLLTITRVVPLVLLPAAIALFALFAPARRTVALAAIGSTMVSAIVLGNMAANEYRYGRFELSNSGGRHLWNAVSDKVDVMLEGSVEFERLRRADPEVVGKEWWEVRLEHIPVNSAISREAYLGALSAEAIYTRPDVFAGLGVARARVLMASFPRDFGRWRSTNPVNNLLDRDSPLPALVPALAWLTPVMVAIHHVAERAHPFIMWLLGTVLFYLVLSGTGAQARSASRSGGRPGGLLWRSLLVAMGIAWGGILHLPWIAVFALSVLLAWWLGRRDIHSTNQPNIKLLRWEGELLALMASWSFLIFVACLWASAQLETPSTRVIAPFLVLLAIPSAAAMEALGFRGEWQRSEGSSPTGRP